MKEECAFILKEACVRQAAEYIQGHVAHPCNGIGPVGSCLCNDPPILFRLSSFGSFFALFPWSCPLPLFADGNRKLCRMRRPSKQMSPIILLCILRANTTTTTTTREGVLARHAPHYTQ